ncbi:MAG: hypothetical protein U0S36_05990 [Candidatus Nanopelagicales bacterium]
MSATARDGRAVLRTELDVDCAGGFVPPPTLQLEITTSRGTFPRQAQIVDATLAGEGDRGLVHHHRRAAAHGVRMGGRDLRAVTRRARTNPESQEAQGLPPGPS